MPRSSATGCQATTRSLATSATSTAVGAGTTFSARATASRPSTRRDSRASSSSAPASSCPVVRSVSAASRSSRSRSAASGVRSWCDTSAITARFPCTRASSRPAIVLNVDARRRSSGGPESTTARLSISPSASRPAALSSPASGLLTHRARPKASKVAPIMATTAIVPRMTQSSTMSRFSDVVALARITVPTRP